MIELVADRFVCRDDGTVYDLATAAPVMFIRSPVAGVSEQTRWAARCEWFTHTHHPCVARLLDFGRVGETQRFEAWEGRCIAERRDGIDDTVSRASRFLTALGLTTGELSARDVLTSGDTVVVVPPADAGYEAARDPSGSGECALDNCGIQRIERRAVTALRESIEDTDHPRPRALSLWGAKGSGVQTAIYELARVARARGFVPFSTAWTDREIVRLVRDRSLMLIDWTAGGSSPRTLCHWTVRTARPHVLVAAARQPIAGMEGAHLAPVPHDSLVAAVIPLPGVSSTLRTRIERAARMAAGSPGAFTDLLWGRRSPSPAHSDFPAHPAAPARPALLKAAESQPRYGESAHEPSSAIVPRIWNTPAEEAARQSALDAAVDQVSRGRHASGDRALRASAAASARRHDWARAARALIALAASLLKRGQPLQADALLRAAREYAAKPGADALITEIAVLAGTAVADLGRFDESEHMLTAALGAARADGEPNAIANVALALARCLFWRGRYQDAEDLLASIEGTACGDRVSAEVAAARSRNLVGCQDLAGATRSAATALLLAQRLGDSDLVAAAGCASAFVHLAAEDRTAVERDVTIATEAARAAHAPLLAVDARLIAGETARRLGEPRDAVRIMRKLERLAPALPFALRARYALLASFIHASSPNECAELVSRQVRKTGLPALALFAPRPAERAECGTDAFDDVLDILRLCQMADEDRVVLEHLCARLRDRLRASSIGVFTIERGEPMLFASNGPKLERSMAVRAIETRQAIAPHRWRDAIEAAAPIEYAGETLGALAARWTIAASPARNRVTAALTLGATVAGPIVAACVRRSAPGDDDFELLGLSPAILEIRRTVDRTALVPFPVLIEGESGCGKELVARALHGRSPRRTRPFCALNCAALPEDLVEAELFGHARGAFTGALTERLGAFEEAHTGTLFLDEIGELSARAQAKILRTIQEGELKRIGENLPRRVDVRIVAATNRDLRQEASLGRFRVDLLYRLDVVRINLPPLRERREDIAVLAEHFWREATARIGSRATLSTATIAALSRHEWPGNVRELQNVLAALAVRTPKRGSVPPSALPAVFHVDVDAQTWRLDQARRNFEERFIRAALVRTGGHRARAAEELGLTRQGLSKVMNRLGIAILS